VDILDSEIVRKKIAGLSDWFSFDEQILKQTPDQRGAYVFRSVGGRSFGRLKGKSDILYIGSTTSKRGLRQRFYNYLHPGPTQWTNQRIHDLLKRYQMEVAWFVCKKPVNIENSLLTQYEREHDELPPLNHANVRSLHESPAEVAMLTDKLKVTLVKGE